MTRSTSQRDHKSWFSGSLASPELIFAPQGETPVTLIASQSELLAIGRVTLELTNGCEFWAPVLDVQDLDSAGEVLGRGLELHWERLDVDLSVPGLRAGLFGTKASMDRQRAALSGAARSEAKSAAARSQGGRLLKMGGTK